MIFLLHSGSRKRNRNFTKLVRVGQLFCCAGKSVAEKRNSQRERRVLSECKVALPLVKSFNVAAQTASRRW